MTRPARPIALAMLFVALLYPSVGHALPEGAWVVAIGHNRGDADEVALRFAERDAEQLLGVLEDVGDLDPARTVRVLGRDADDVRKALDDVHERMRSDGGDGVLLVFYSGHADARALHLGGTHLPIAELTERVEQAPGTLKLLIIDACRSGAASRVKGMRPAEDFVVEVDDRVRAEGMAIITSSTAGEDSQESDQLRASFFSHHLVNGLRGAADKNGDDRVTLAEAYAYTYAQTLRSSGRTLNLQHPTYRFDIKGRGEVILARLEEAGTQVGRLQLASPAVYVVTEGSADGPIAAEVSPARADAQIVLPPSRYHVQERRPREYREYAIEVRPGAVARLADTAYASVSYDRLVRARGSNTRSVHGFVAMGGARGGLLGGEGTTPQAVIGYQADMPWFSIGARARFGQTAVDVDPVAARQHREYGLSLLAERVVDLPWLSVGFGALVEGTWHEQTFTGPRTIDPRQTVGAAFGILVALERHLPGAFALRLEGGPYSALLEVTDVDQGVVVGSEITTPLTWWVAGGLKWRL